MIQITTVGRVTADLELKESAKKVPYLRFDLAVTKGYGEGKHTVFLPCWAFQSIAQRMESAGVKKGSQIMISGDLDVVDFERRDGSKGKVNKVSVYDWQFVASGKKEEKEESAPVYDEHTCADEDDLPM